jgi:hypothetical protein
MFLSVTHATQGGPSSFEVAIAVIVLVLVFGVAGLAGIRYEIKKDSRLSKKPDGKHRRSTDDASL